MHATISVLIKSYSNFFYLILLVTQESFYKYINETIFQKRAKEFYLSTAAISSRYFLRCKLCTYRLHS